MGEWYEFEIKIVDGREVFGFCYQNENTGWKEIFVEMTADQREVANQLLDEYEAIRQRQRKIIRGWIND